MESHNSAFQAALRDEDSDSDLSEEILRDVECFSDEDDKEFASKYSGA